MTQEKKNRLLKSLLMYKSFGIKYHEEISFSKNSFIDKEHLPSDISSLESYVKNCTLCELSKHSNMEPLFGIGNVNSDVYIIGTNFGFLDNNLNNILKNMVQNVLMIDFKNIYMTNIIKCESNGTNLDNFVNICKDYLIKQIEINKPKYIITIGDSFNYMMDNNSQIVDVSGNIYDFMDSKLIPMLDLNFVYKNPSYKQEMFTDLQKIKTLMEQE